MKKWIISVGMLTAFSIGIIACGDKSSSPSPKSGQDYCKIVSSDPLVLEAVQEGVYSKTTFDYSDSKLVQKVEFRESEYVQLACASYKKDSDYGDVECNGNSIVAYSDERLTKSEYNLLLTKFASVCDGSMDFEEESSSSSDKEWSSDDAESSSSKVNKFFEDEPSSSSQKKSSSSFKESSSSRRTESSSSVESSSSAESSSSDEVNLDGAFNWMDKAWYKKEKVVASNAAELQCTETHEPEDFSEYEVAYEFDDAKDLGRDYLGENNAYIDVAMSPVSAECGSIVLDGTNGLLIPLSDTFKNKGFVAEVRFMPFEKGGLSNIFVADPPGSGVDGWQIRLDGSVVKFHYRDSDNGWSVLNVDEVSMNEWHVIRVKIFPTKSGSGEIFYSLNVRLDGSLRVASEFKSDISDLEYGLGIGYDAMYQSLHDRRFFTGKIDYIRYGNISEDNL